MKRLATFSMALIFGTLTMAAAPALAGGKGQHSSGSNHHDSSSSSSCHKKPCDPCKDKCPSGGTTAPVHPPVNTIHPILSPIVRDHRGNNTNIGTTSGGVSIMGDPVVRDHRGTGATTVIFNGSTLPITPVSTGNPHKGKGNQTAANPTTPVGEALQGLGDALGDAFSGILDPGFSGPPVK